MLKTYLSSSDRVKMFLKQYWEPKSLLVEPKTLLKGFSGLGTFVNSILGPPKACK